jgi:hypothetical protein
MHLVQLLLPLYGNEGSRIAEPLFAQVRHELTELFGGVTAYSQAPATGLWQTEAGTAERDIVILVEVVVPALDRAWWTLYRSELEHRFQQAEIHARAIPIESF